MTDTAPETPITDAPVSEPPPADGGAAPDIAEDVFYNGWPEPAIKAHRELKDENVKYKERFRPFEQTFGSLHEDDREFFLGFVDAVREQDSDALKQYAPHLRSYLDKMTPAEQRAVAKAVDEATEEEYDPYDKTHVEKLAEAKATAMFAERDAADAKRREEADHKARVDEASKTIASAAAVAATEHGIPEWADTTSDLYGWLVSTAHRRFAGESSLEARMAKAAEHCTAELDRRGQELLKAKSAAAGNKPAPQGGEQPSGQKVPTTLDEASESAMKRLEALAQGPG